VVEKYEIVCKKDRKQAHDGGRASPILPEQKGAERDEGNFHEHEGYSVVIHQVTQKDVRLLCQTGSDPIQSKKGIDNVHDNDGFRDPVQPSKVLRCPHLEGGFLPCWT
jgi:hypothetical protein